MDIEENNNEVTVYELGYHLVPTVEETEVPSMVVRVKALVEGKGCKVISEEAPQARTLAYEIVKPIDSKNQKFAKTYFGWMKFECDREATSSIKEGVSHMKEILRFIIVKTDRETTLYSSKVVAPRREEKEVVEPKEVLLASKKEVSEEDIDKSIEALIS